MVGAQDDSPLMVIRRKEQELAHQIGAARRATEALIAQAQQRATAITRTAERDGRRAAEAHYQQEQARAKQEAARIKAAGQHEALLLHQVGRRELDRAVQAIIEFVLSE